MWSQLVGSLPGHTTLSAEEDSKIDASHFCVIWLQRKAIVNKVNQPCKTCMASTVSSSRDENHRRWIPGVPEAHQRPQFGNHWEPQWRLEMIGIVRYQITAKNQGVKKRRGRIFAQRNKFSTLYVLGHRYHTHRTHPKQVQRHSSLWFVLQRHDFKNRSRILYPVF